MKNWRPFIFYDNKLSIVRSRSLLHRINYKFMCLSAYWRYELANDRARICAVIVKIQLDVYDGEQFPEMWAILSG